METKGSFSFRDHHISQVFPLHLNLNSFYRRLILTSKDCPRAERVNCLIDAVTAFGDRWWQITKEGYIVLLSILLAIHEKPDMVPYCMSII